MTTLRPLGSSGLETPPLVLGGNVFGWTADRDASFAVLDAFVAGGGRMIDTADVYSMWVPGNQGGESEAIIGEWLKRRGRRDDVLIATKVGFTAGLSARSIAEGAEASLRRLGVDAIDLYYSHKDDPSAPQEETAAAFDTLVKAGKVRALGASQISAERLASALAIAEREGLTPYTALQPEYNLIAREGFEGPLQRLAVERKLGVLSFYGLASGFLTGKYRKESDLHGARSGAAKKYMEAGHLRTVEAMDEIAAETGATLAQIALAWVAAQPGVTAPIASATSVAQVEELLGAMSLELSRDQLARLDAAAQQ